MRVLSTKRTACTFALLLGGFHLFWAILVAFRWAQPVSDFLFRIHFIRPVYVIEPFQLGLAVVLVAFTTGVGSVLGWCFAALWNRLHRPLGQP